eukprot:766538-Hanusia_phi.AAC.1
MGRGGIGEKGTGGDRTLTAGAAGAREEASELMRTASKVGGGKGGEDDGILKGGVDCEFAVNKILVGGPRDLEKPSRVLGCAMWNRKGGR